jgi:S1-C subfamily serine protease
MIFNSKIRETREPDRVRRFSRRMGALVAAAVLVVLLVGAMAGCSINNQTSATTATPVTTAAAATGAATVANTTILPSTALMTTAGTDAALASPAEGVADIVGPSVVNVAVKGSVQGNFGAQDYSAEGSGVIFTSDGMIVTNNHVVSENDVPVTDITVTLATGEKLPATIVGRDPLTDLAVIKIDKTGLTPAAFVQDMTKVKVGQYAIAIGSPLGYSNSVTMGIVSGLQRELASLVQTQDAQAYIDLIQTDAAISPGNSGGALVNSAGEVMGINVAYLPPQQTGAQNLGFAIPADVVQQTAQQLIQTGKVEHPYLGVSLETVTKDLQSRFSLSLDTGVLVADVGSGTPAADAGLQQGDIIVKMNGQKVTSDVDLFTLLRKDKVGDTVALTIDRNGTSSTVNVTLGQRPQQ